MRDANELVHYLRATKALNARSAVVPNTFLKNIAATVTPEDSICAYHQQGSHQPSQQNKQITSLWRRTEIRNVCKEIQNSADTQSEGSGDLECPHWILNVVEHVVGVRPASVYIQDLEGCCRILYCVVGTE